MTDETFAAIGAMLALAQAAVRHEDMAVAEYWLARVAKLLKP